MLKIWYTRFGLILNLIGTLFISSHIVGLTRLKRWDAYIHQLLKEISDKKEWGRISRTKKIRRIIGLIFFLSLFLGFYFISDNLRISERTFRLFQWILVGYLCIFIILDVLGLLMQHFGDIFKLRMFMRKHRTINGIMAIIFLLPFFIPFIVVGFLLIIFLGVLSIPLYLSKVALLIQEKIGFKTILIIFGLLLIFFGFAFQLYATF